MSTTRNAAAGAGQLGPDEPASGMAMFQAFTEKSRAVLAAKSTECHTAARLAEQADIGRRAATYPTAPSPA